MGDVLSDLRAEPMEMTLMQLNGQVHEGIMSAATYVHCNTAGALQKAAQDHPGTPLLITGHSMGGAWGLRKRFSLFFRGPGGGVVRWV